MLQCSIISYSVCRVTWRDPEKKEQAMPAKNISPQPSGGSPTRELDRSRKVSRAKPERVSLALQGGGAYGAFTWGVLDRLLEEEISFDAVSGASIGAISTTAGVDEFWFCGSSVIVWRAAGVGVASSTKRGCDRDRAALPRRDAR